MAIYSHSRLSSYEKCPQQYKFRYIDRIRRDTQSVEAFMGNRVHEVLERLYRDVQQAKRPSLDDLLSSYDDAWRRQWNDKNITVVKTERGADSYRRAGAECIRWYYETYAPFDDGETLGLEDRFTVTLDEAGQYQLQGYIDRLVRAAPDVYEVHDYKTSSFLPSREDIRRDRQLSLYRMAIAKRFPRAREIRLVWHFLAKQTRIMAERGPQDIEDHRRQTMTLIDTIESTTSYPARESILCKWCEYQDICPLFVKSGAAEPPKPTRWLDKAEQMPLFA